ncbi:MAG: RNA polymerase sigma factor RpoD/SigA [Candidatus Paceibacterota bacterium]
MQQTFINQIQEESVMRRDNLKLIEPETHEEAIERQRNAVVDALSLYFSQIRNPVLSHEETLVLARRYRDERNEAARQALISHNLRLVVHCVREIYKAGPYLEDLIQEGNIGLMIAVEKYDPESGNRFATYAYSWIRQAVFFFLYDKVNTVRLPAWVNEKRRKLRKILTEYKKKELPLPTQEELGKLLELNPDQLRGITSLGKHADVSLDMPVMGDDEEGTTFGDRLQDPQAPDPLIISCARNELAKSLDLVRTFHWVIRHAPKMSERNKEILCDRLGFNLKRERMSLETIAQKHGVTKQAIQQVVKAGFATRRFRDAGMNEKGILALLETIETLSDLTHTPVSFTFE